MSIAEECLKNAEDCEREAAACGPGSSRDILLCTAVQWRRMAQTAAHEETAWRQIAGGQVIQEQQAQQQQTRAPNETTTKT